MWGMAAAVGIASAYAFAAAAGLPRQQTILTLIMLALTLFIGAKAWYLFEAWAFPESILLAPPSSGLTTVLMHGYRSPGGVAAIALVLPPLCAMMGLPILRFADAVTPAIGLAVLWLRLGCFANGCCPGALTDWPLGVRFPPDTPAFYWHVSHGLLSDLGPTQPVHPVQLYYAGLGAALFIAGLLWQRAQLQPGEVWARCLILYFGGNFLLEQLQYPSYPANIILCAAGVLASAALLLWVRSPRTDA
jgi:phosphatidylglycerol---prolipoprotein diacylglyceryl transferase